MRESYHIAPDDSLLGELDSMSGTRSPFSLSRSSSMLETHQEEKEEEDEEEEEEDDDGIQYSLVPKPSSQDEDDEEEEEEEEEEPWEDLELTKASSITALSDKE